MVNEVETLDDIEAANLFFSGALCRQKSNKKLCAKKLIFCFIVQFV
jgi:hypothetical protein